MKLYSLSEGLKRARKEAGYTQKELREELEHKGISVHLKTIMNWEQEISSPTFDTLMELTRFYDCDLDYLTGNIDCKTHDIQFIHDQTGLSEKAIQTLMKLTAPQQDMISRILEHKDIVRAVRDMSALSDKEAVSEDLSNLTKAHVIGELKGKKTTPVHGNMIEKAMLYSISTVLTNIVSDVTDTEL